MFEAAINPTMYAEVISRRPQKVLPTKKKKVGQRKHPGFVFHESFDALSTENELWGTQESRRPTGQDQSSEARPSLTAQEEKTLFLRYNYAKYRLAYGSARITGSENGPTERGTNIWAKRAEAAPHELILANMPLVHFAAKYANVGNPDYADFLSEGYLIIMACVEKFNISRGYKFSTYACRALLSRFCRLTGKSNKLRRRFGTTLEPWMTKSQTYSTTRHQEQADYAVSDLGEIVRRNSAELNSTEQFVITQRYLSASQKRPTLADVGKSMGMSKESARRIEAEGLAKLRRTLEGKLIV